MSLYSAQLYPGWALGDIFVLGAFLHAVLTRVKAEPQNFPKIKVICGRTNLVRGVILVELPANGIRLRFDGPEQRLRLIEVTDFTKNHIYYKPTANDKERDLMRPAGTASGTSTEAHDAPNGPTFRHIYQKFLGPTYGGEFVPGNSGGRGIYVLSYPGVAFNFYMPNSEYTPEKDAVTLLSSSSTPQIAAQMGIFSGDSWAQARDRLFDTVLPSITTFPPFAKSKDVYPDEISLVKVHGGGKLQLFRKWTTNSFWLTLGETTEEQLIRELGPPDAIYRKNEQNMAIHKQRAASNTMARPDGDDLKRLDDLTDTDQSSAHTSSGADDDSSDDAVEDDLVANVSGECFYNYFYHGFDILVSTPTKPSQPPPSRQKNPLPAESESFIKPCLGDKLVATKVIIHSNIPKSYQFNRHRRCRWEIAYLESANSGGAIDSETAWPKMQECMEQEWKCIYSSEEAARHEWRGMVINRGWGESPTSSLELLGGWEDNGGQEPDVSGKKSDGSLESRSTLYGYPGLVFEVLKNGYLSSLCVV